LSTFYSYRVLGSGSSGRNRTHITRI